MLELRDYQREAVDAAVRYLKEGYKKPGIIVLPTGCHAAGTIIPLMDGTMKKVEDVKVGDHLIGDDGTKRTVLRLHRGTGKLYRLTPGRYGKPFVVNEDHILSLVVKKRVGVGKETKMDKIELTLKEWLSKKDLFKNNSFLWKPEYVDFKEEEELAVPPYLLGLLLGESGSVESIPYMKRNAERVKEWEDQLGKIRCVNVRKRTYERTVKVALYPSIEKNGRNLLMEKLAELCLYGKRESGKFIPREYIASSMESRMELIRGFVDSGKKEEVRSGTVVCRTGSRILAEQMEFLIRSVGMRASAHKTEKDGYTVRITDWDRKYNERRNSVSANYSTFKAEYVGDGEYFGFEVDGNHLYCDSDLNVHHNSGKSLIPSAIIKEIGEPALVLQPSKEILKQNYEKALSFGLNPKLYSASVGVKEIGEVTYATLKSVKKAVPELKEAGIKTIIVDEAHFGYSPEKESEFMKFIGEMGKVKVIGMTATPCRLHNCGTIGDSYSVLTMLTKERPGFFRNMVYVAQIGDMVRRGYWAKVKYEVWDFDDSLLVENTNGSEYTMASIKESIQKNGLNNSIYIRILELLKERRFILACMDSVETCNTISEFMNKKFGKISSVVTSETPQKERDKNVEEFKSGKIKVMFNYSALSTGFDFPELDCVIMGRPTMSFAILYQIFGRVVRPHKDKEEALFVDCCNNYKRFGRIENVTVEENPIIGWCMFSDNKLLTGARMDDVVTREEVERGRNPRMRRGSRMDNMIMGFGKYKGKLIKSIPMSYWKWAIMNTDKESQLNRMARKYIESLNYGG